MKSRKYHHSDLPRRLRETAAEIVRTQGLEKLTLRGLGKRLGVSRAAPYRHFANRTALLCAVAEDGFHLLLDELRPLAANRRRSARRRLADLSAAYVGFATDNPEMYRLMFGPDIVRSAPTESLTGAARAAFDEIAVSVLREAQEKGEIRRGDPVSLVNVMWAFVHGLALLLIDGQLVALDRNHELHKLLAPSAEASLLDPQPMVQLSIKTMMEGLGSGS